MAKKYAHISPAPRALLIGYKATLSAALFAIGVRCRHEPTCSEYAAEAWSRHGFLNGVRLGMGRFVRCRPGGTHGYDSVPDEKPGWHFVKPTTTTTTPRT
ncbi:MAG: membrane protein insertion efficiency factor YidD [Ponticaulis sp.]|nr:membrane protein insertion efficiency factor YidD [Ponticaulis sp.]|tara:strand:- start:21145 stop:21444 length:300 start_codon:yes stop_codon:yes gene_type:complete